MQKRQWQVRFNRRESVIYNFATGKKLRGGNIGLINEAEFEEIQRNKYFTIISSPLPMPVKERETVESVLKDIPVKPDTGTPIAEKTRRSRGKRKKEEKKD